jgi:hypothetical protein
MIIQNLLKGVPMPFKGVESKNFMGIIQGVSSW